MCVYFIDRMSSLLHCLKSMTLTRLIHHNQTCVNIDDSNPYTSDPPAHLCKCGILNISYNSPIVVAFPVDKFMKVWCIFTLLNYCVFFSFSTELFLLLGAFPLFLFLLIIYEYVVTISCTCKTNEINQKNQLLVLPTHFRHEHKRHGTIHLRGLFIHYWDSIK